MANYFVVQILIFLQFFFKLWFNVLLDEMKYQDSGMNWILHLDTDELIHPAGAREYSSRQLLLDVPGHVDMVIFPNYVSRICRLFLIVY